MYLRAVNAPQASAGVAQPDGDLVSRRASVGIMRLSLRMYDGGLLVALQVNHLDARPTSRKAALSPS